MNKKIPRLGDFYQILTLFFDNINNRHLEHDIFARQFWDIFRWECDVNIAFFALYRANQLFFEARNELTTA